VAIVATFSFLISSVVQKCMLRDVETMNGTSLMYIIGVVNIASKRVFFLHVKKIMLEASGIEKPFHSLQVIFFIEMPNGAYM
jgi:hypothetical protein